ncbi:hypothetical protein BDV19DRAFT_384806 [Aspergillus venezuelensis]
MGGLVDCCGISVPVTEWGNFIELVDGGNDPYTWGTRTGNWTALDCNHHAVKGKLQMPAEERWEQLGCAEARKDAIRTWRNDYKPRQYKFSEAIFDILYAGPQSCGLGTEDADCDDALSCTHTQGDGTGPAGWKVLNSLIEINAMFTNYYQLLSSPEGCSGVVEDYTTAFNVLMDILGILVPSAMAPAFNSDCPPQYKYFTANPNNWTQPKALSTPLLEAGLTSPKKKTLEINIPSLGKNIRLHSAKALRRLRRIHRDTHKLIKNGQLIEGLLEKGSNRLPRYSRAEMQELVEGSFYSYAIPQVWQESSHSVFWLGTGDHDCDDSNPVSDYIFDATAETTSQARHKEL